jgi:hypothetical protein
VQEEKGTENRKVTQIYAITADMSESAVQKVQEKTKYFAGIFDMLSPEVMQMIADNAIAPIISVSPMSESG